MIESAHYESCKRTRSRLTPDKCKPAALLALVVLFATPARSEDLIEQWLKQDESGCQTEELRQDLNALTDAQWKSLFKFGREETDAELGRQLLRRVNEKHTSSLYLWIAAVLAGLLISGIKARTFIRREAASALTLARGSCDAERGGSG